MKMPPAPLALMVSLLTTLTMAAHGPVRAGEEGGASPALETEAAKDSIGIEKRGGRWLVLYKVGAGETLYQITRRYRTTQADVEKLNEGQLRGGIKVGQVIRVPALSQSGTSGAGATAGVAPAPSPVPPGASRQRVHKVAAGETLFGLARKYGVSVAQLRAANNLSGQEGLHEGQQINIDAPGTTDPALTAAPPATAPAPAPPTTSAPAPAQPAAPAPAATIAPGPDAQGRIRHTVRTGETLFAIARTYNTRPERITADNNLSAGGIEVGQVLIISPGSPPENRPAPSLAQKVAEQSGVALEDTTPAETRAGMSTQMGYEKIIERGTAEMVDHDAGGSRFFCLHRTAPIGRIVMIRNEMNGAVVFARVVDRLPDTGHNNKVLIKLSRRAFDKLGAGDSRFPVEVSYPAQ